MAQTLRQWQDAQAARARPGRSKGKPPEVVLALPRQAELTTLMVSELLKLGPREALACLTTAAVDIARRGHFSRAEILAAFEKAWNAWPDRSTRP